MTMTTEAARRPAVDGDDRADILRFASVMLDPSDRQRAELVTEMAAPLLDWAGQARDRNDLLLRMRAMRRQEINTPKVYRPVPAAGEERRSWLPWQRMAASGAPQAWVLQSVITTAEEFLAETAVLYAFIAER